jgi:hypothetical protein
MRTLTFLTGYGPTPPSFSLTTRRKLSHINIIKLVEELLLGFLAGEIIEALSLRLLTCAVTEALSLGLLACAVANPKNPCPSPYDGTPYSRRIYSSAP